MFICLSSGYRPRYLRDIARALALPYGSWLAFRYERQWIPEGLQRELESKKQREKLRGSEILIAYVDQSSDGRPIEVVPCRYARLVDVASVGQTASLQLEIRDFAHAEDLGAFNKHLRETYPMLLPRRKDDGGFEGAYWFQVSAAPGVTHSDDDAIWERIIAQLASRPDFAQERFFYSVLGIIEIGREKARRPRKNLVRLRPSRDYELRLYHYYPSDNDGQAQLQASVAGASLEFTATPEVLLDSRYDLKRIPFRTGAPVPGQRGVLTLRRRRPSDDEWEWDLDVGLRIAAAWLRQTIFGLLVAVGLAVPPIVAAYQNSSLSNHAQRVITVVSVIASVAVAVAAAFGLRRSV